MGVHTFGRAPDPPDWLDDLAIEHWRKITPMLLDVLTPLDLDALAKYCQCFSTYKTAQAFIRAHGSTMMVRNDKGELKIIQAVPQVGISLKMMSEMRHYEKAFGLTPLAR